ncbi:9202_t:CDS:2, partial [Racocetra persica]
KTELRTWKAILQACGCTNVMPYLKTNDRKEFWNNSEFSQKSHIIINENENKNTFWNTNEFIYLQLHEKLQ